MIKPLVGRNVYQHINVNVMSSTLDSSALVNAKNKKHQNEIKKEKQEIHTMQPQIQL